MSKIYENDIKRDENNVGIEIQGEGDFDLEERRSEDSAGKGMNPGPNGGANTAPKPPSMSP